MNDNPGQLAASATPFVAVIGSGYWGKNLVRIYHALGALKLICDKDETVLAHFQQRYPDVEVCLSLQDVLTRDDISGVVIATPAETHFSLAREALLAGKHVYVEKPLVLGESEARELIQYSEEQKLTLMVGHLLQYHPIFVRLRELAASGELGRINYIYSHRLNVGKIRREENSLWSFAPHDISMILALAGESPDYVLATGGNYLHKKIADVTTTHLEFPSGLKAHVFVSWLHPFKVQQLVVVGDRKMAVFDDTRPWGEKLLLYPHEIKWENHVPILYKADPEKVPVIQAEPLLCECQHFLHCVQSGRRPLTDGREALEVLRILNCSQRSLERNGVRIRLREMGAAAVEATPGASRPYFVHPTAVIDEGAEVGAGTKIWHFSHVLAGSHIGEGCNIGQNVVIGPDVAVGRGCKIQNNVSVYKGVTLEDYVFCGPSMVFTNIHSPRAAIRKMDQVRRTVVKEGATLGANCTIVCGVTIGRYAFVGAGAVVTRDVPDHALVVGNPARRIGWACQCGDRLDDTLVCPACAAHYAQDGNGLKRELEGVDDGDRTDMARRSASAHTSNPPEPLASGGADTGRVDRGGSAAE
ncbi:MAG: Gfo/Idh/MocA family oxidoreductase [Acidobacteriota bacterium]